MLLSLLTAHAWTHRGHVWEDDALPLRVCAEGTVDVPARRAMALWNQSSGVPWFVHDCEAPQVRIGMDPDDAGPLARFTLHPEVWAPGDCEYVSITEGRIDIVFSDEIDWSADVGTAVGPCPGADLQTRLIVRYLGVALGLDSSAAPGAMHVLDTCDALDMSMDDHAGLAALYANPRICMSDVATSDGPTEPVPTEPSAGCTTTGPARMGWWPVALFSRR
ncbi:MAG: hypothetical protein R3F61_25490 [Myxococcota bacterium]